MWRSGYTVPMRTAVILVLICLTLTGCTRLRFIVDAVPSGDAMTETIVLDDRPRGWSVPKVAMIEVTGLIADAKRSGLLQQGFNPVGEFLEALQRAERDQAVRAVIIRINSPGGTVTASDVMHRELLGFRERSGKPAIIFMSDVAASGGYYLACAGDEIIAHPTTITGSIGVVIQTFNVHEGLRRIGIRAEAITSGPNKAAGSPFEPPMSPAQRALFQGLVDEFYDNFVTLVRSRRPSLSMDHLEEVTDGRVVTGRRALEVGLIDELGDLRTAFNAAKRRMGVETARLVKYHRPLDYVGSAYSRVLGDASGGVSGQINLLQLNLGDLGSLNQPGFYYLWDPTAFDVSGN